MTNEEAFKTLKENLCVSCAYGSQNMESCDIRSCDNRDAIRVLERNLCDSCINKGCIFQSGIVRNHCDFYKAESDDIKALEKQPCDDCVSRQAVLEKAINIPIASVVTEDKVICRKIVFVDDIEQLPPVTPKGVTITDFADRCRECGKQKTKWIPISRGLPKVADCYDVTRKSGSDLIVSSCYFDGINWHNGNWTNYERNYLTDVVAWMPRPEPMKVGEENC